MLSNRKITGTETNIPDKIIGQNSDGSYRIMKGSELNTNIATTVKKIVDQESINKSNLLSNLNPNTNQHVQNIGPSLSEQIRQKSKSNFVINVNSQQDGMIIVETDHDLKRFTFYSSQKSYLGSFSVFEFIKYITSNVSNIFLQNTDLLSATPVIEKYIGTIKKLELPTVRYEIKMFNYLESPFMGNVETLIKFYTFINEFENSQLQQELNILNSDEKIKVKNMFNQMVHTLLTHILKIIAALTNKITSNTDSNLDPIKTKDIKNSLLKYSVSIMYRLSKFVKNEIDQKVGEINRLDVDLFRVEEIRNKIQSKLDSVQRSVDLQNSKIDIIIKNNLINTNVSKMEIPVVEIPIDDKGSESDTEDNIEDISDASEYTSTLDKGDIINQNISNQDSSVQISDSNINKIIDNVDYINKNSTNTENTNTANNRINMDGKQIITSNLSISNKVSNIEPITEQSSKSSSTKSSTEQSSKSSSTKSSTENTGTSISSTPKTLEDLLVN
jgi:hypothetical protein